MFLFEDGKIIEEAYVEINGIKYPVHMPKYEGKTPLSSENLNKMQKELQANIETLSSNIAIAQIWTGTVTAKQDEIKNLNLDCSGYDIIVYRVRSDYAHYQNIVRVVEDNDICVQVELKSSENYSACGTIKYIRSSKTIEMKGEQIKGWDSISLERIYGIKLNKTTEATSEEGGSE